MLGPRWVGLGPGALAVEAAGVQAGGMRMVALAVLVALLGAGCAQGGAAEDSSVPEGFELYESDALRFAYPSAWEVSSEPVDDAREVEVRDDTGDGALRAGVAAYQTDGSPFFTLDQFVDQANTELDLRTDDREVMGEEEFTLADGTEARLLEVSYSSTAGGAPATVRELMVLALVDESGLILRAAVAEDRYDEYAEVFRTIAGTFGPSPSG